MMRLFLGIELPESDRKALAALDPHIKGLRWLPPDQLHLTLSFLGGVPDEKLEPLQEVLREVHVAPFFLPIQGIGAFGGDWPGVVWAGVGRGHPHLFALHKHIQDTVLHAGLEPDLRPFHPHITLARARGVSRATLRPFLRQYEDAEFSVWKVTGFALFSSTLSSEGAQHALLMRLSF